LKQEKKSLLKQSMRLGFFSLLFCLCLALPVQAGRFSLLHTAGVKGLASNYHYQIQQPYQLIHEYARQNPDAMLPFGLKDLRKREFSSHKT